MYKGMSFNSRMVKAIQRGHKTVTRRPKFTTKLDLAPGEIIYVKEAWRTKDGDIDYRASKDKVEVQNWNHPASLPARHARFFLCVDSICVERLQDIDDGEQDEYIAEGLPSDWAKWGYGCESEWYVAEWADCYPKTFNPDIQWDQNPWVWVIRFHMVDKDKINVG